MASKVRNRVRNVSYRGTVRYHNALSINVFLDGTAFAIMRRYGVPHGLYRLKYAGAAGQRRARGLPVLWRGSTWPIQ